MGLQIYIKELGKTVQACKPIEIKLKEIMDSLIEHFRSAKAKNLREQINNMQKQCDDIVREMDKSTTHHSFDMREGDLSGTNNYIQSPGSGQMIDGLPVDRPHQISPSTEINRYGQDGGYGNGNFGHLLRP